MRVILRNLVSQWGLYILNAGMLLGITPLLVHGLGGAAFGIWVIGGNTVAWMMVLDFGIGSAVLRFGALILKQSDEAGQELNRLFNSSLALFFIIGFIAVAISAGVGVFVPEEFFSKALSRHEFFYFSLCLGLALTLNFWGQPFSALLQAHQRFDLVNLVKAGVLMLRIVAYAWLMTQGYGLMALALVTLLSSLLSTLVFVIVSRQVFDWHISILDIKLRWAHKLFGYGWMMLVIIIADQLRFATDAIVIGAYVSLSLVTVYTIGATLTTVFREVIGAMVPIFVPIFSSSNSKEAVSPKFLLVTRIFSLFVWGCGLLLLLGAAPFIDVWMGHYPQSVEITFILMTGFLIASSQSLSFSLLYGRAKHFPVVVISIVDALANLGLSIWLVQDYGIIGVAVGTAIPFIITYGIVFPVVVSRSVNIPYLLYFREALLVPIAFSGLMLVCTQFVWKSWSPEGWLELIAISFCVLCSYVILAWLSVVGADGRYFLKNTVLKSMRHKGVVS
ncbi:MAG: lipopolysaccharide biosynthesis protein [Ghiorsea sp.]